MQAVVEKITPETAATYLAKNAGNRSYNQTHLNNLMGRLQRHEWIPNGDAIRFDTAGNLRDGQHRLKMVVLSGIPIETVVVRDIDPGAFITMDTGKRRSLADVLSILGHEESRLLAASLPCVRRYVMRRPPGTPSYEEYRITLEKHPDLEKSIEFFKSVDQPAGAPGHPELTVATHYLFSKVSQEAANDFLTRLVTGLNLNNANDPIKRLRDQLVGYQKAKSKGRIPSGDALFQIYVKAWNVMQTTGQQKAAYSIPNTPQAIKGFPKDLIEVGHGQLGLIDNDEEAEAA